MIRALFLDGCGTLWYPRATRREKNPFWIYQDPVTSADPDAHMELTPGARQTLRAARAAGVATVLLSTSPHDKAHAEGVLRRRVQRFGLTELLDEVHATADRHPAKREAMAVILERRGIPHGEALMVGDRYVWDYRPARDIGVPARLIESAYEAERTAADRSVETIGELNEIVPLLGGE